MSAELNRSNIEELNSYRKYNQQRWDDTAKFKNQCEVEWQDNNILKFGNKLLGLVGISPKLGLVPIKPNDVMDKEAKRDNERFDFRKKLEADRREYEGALSREETHEKALELMDKLSNITEDMEYEEIANEADNTIVRIYKLDDGVSVLSRPVAEGQIVLTSNSKAGEQFLPVECRFTAINGSDMIRKYRETLYINTNCANPEEALIEGGIGDDYQDKLTGGSPLLSSNSESALSFVRSAIKSITLKDSLEQVA